MLNKVRQLWRLWAKALGAKEGATDREADMVAIIRTLIFLFGVLFSLWGAYTNYKIVQGIERHWNDGNNRTSVWDETTK
jgi:hypothetical protein